MTATADRRCFACGKPLDVGDRFCPRCGTRLAKARRAAVLDGTSGGWTTLTLAFPDDPAPPAIAPARDPPTPLVDGSCFDRGPDGDFGAADTADPTGPFVGASIASAFERLAGAVARLPERSRLVVARRFGLAPGGRLQTLAQVAEALGVTRERIRQIERQVLPFLNPADVGRFPALSIAQRLELLGPLTRGQDDRYDLPSEAIGVAAEKRVRRLNAMIRAIQRLGPSHFTTIARETNGFLPAEYRLSERDVHSWLGRYDDVFIWAGKGRYGLASQDVGIRAAPDAPNTGPPEVYRSRRRKGIGDEIVLLLLERGPTPIEAVTEHILPRFRVNPASVVAAVQQDAARRFTTTGDRLVALREPGVRRDD